MIALREINPRQNISNRAENIIYTLVQRAPGSVTNVAKLVNFLVSSGRDAVVHEDIVFTGALLANPRLGGGPGGPLTAEYNLYRAERGRLVAATRGADRAVASLVGANRVMVAVAFIGGGGPLAHFLLARIDGGQIYVMNPDGASDTLISVADWTTWTTTPGDFRNFGVTNYMYLGIHVVIS
jgi:hypothetical protein